MTKIDFMEHVWRFLERLLPLALVEGAADVLDARRGVEVQVNLAEVVLGLAVEPSCRAALHLTPSFRRN